MGKTKNQLRRWLYIDKRIRSGDYPNTTHFIKGFLEEEGEEISIRTIMRDLEFLKTEFNAPIEYDPYQLGYFYSKKNYRLSILNLKESELFALMIAEKALEQYKNTPVHRKLMKIFDKIHRILDEKIEIKASWLNFKYTFLYPGASIVEDEVWETVFRGLEENREMEILYTKPGEEAEKRLIHPYHIVNNNGTSYLIAYCMTRQGIRVFALSRIQNPRLTERQFEISKDFQIEEFLQKKFGVLPEEEEKEIKIRFNPDAAFYIKERIWFPEQKLSEEKDGSLTLSFQTRSLPEVKRWVMNWGKNAKVLAPEILISDIKNELKAMSALY
ncbi:MAG: hypothetical protein A2Y41_07125 [Spirochaetes bacterium GWB1_36_13]|nr:MAG: hypothetical protein A2Y41_07125 [Spirochaetes bacterium GWB1_36_13]